MAKVIVFGSLNMDMSVEVDSLPQAGTSAIGRAFVISPGGKGANQAVACSRMTAETYMIGKVGDDDFGRDLVASLARHGVSCINVTTNYEHPTGTAIVLREPGNSRVVVDPGANYGTTIQETRAALRGIARGDDFFLTQLECDFEVTCKAIEFAHQQGLTTVLNASPARKLPDSTYAAVDLLCINEDECQTLSGIFPKDDETALAALKWFEDKGVGRTVITLGQRGSLTEGKDGGLFKVGSYEVETVDATGASSAYVGELVAHLSFGGSIEDGMSYATAAAALCVTKLGTQQAMPSWAEVQGFVATHEGGPERPADYDAAAERVYPEAHWS